MNTLYVFFLFNKMGTHHWCIVVHGNVFQQQNIFFSRMNQPSDDSSRRIFPVQFWDLLHTLQFLSEIKKFNYFFFFFFLSLFLLIFKTLSLDLTMKKLPKKPEENTQA